MILSRHGGRYSTASLCDEEGEDGGSCVGPCSVAEDEGVLEEVGLRPLL